MNYLVGGTPRGWVFVTWGCFACLNASFACSNARDEVAEGTDLGGAPGDDSAPVTHGSDGTRDAGAVSSEVTPSASHSNGTPTRAIDTSDERDATPGEATDTAASTAADTHSGADASEVPSPLAPAPGPDYAFARGGSRLGAVHFVAQGAERFLHFYDRQLETECAFEKVVGQDAYACAPSVAVKLHYLDAECAQPIVLSDGINIANGMFGNPGGDYPVAVPGGFGGSLVTTRGGEPSCPPEGDGRFGEPGSARGSDLPELGEVSAVYEVGETFALTPDDSGLATVFELRDGECQSTTAMVRIRTPADRAYHLEPLTIEHLVTAQVRTFEAGPQLDVQRLVASDGSWQTWSAVDRGGETCELVADGRCVPGPITQLYHAALFPAFPCSEPAVDVLVANDSVCTGRYGMSTTTGETKVFDVVAAGGAGYYQQRGKFDLDTGEVLGYECGAVASGWVAKGETQREFATAEVSLVGAPALRARTWVARGEYAVVSLVRDVAFLLADDRSCDVTLFDDGVYRCHKESPGEIDGVTYPAENRVRPYGSGMYVDEACSKPLYVEQVGVNHDAPFWNLTTSFHAVVPYDGEVYQANGDGCYPLPGTSFGSTVFVESDELPIAVPVVERVEL